jgi:hypothetical protein
MFNIAQRLNGITDEEKIKAKFFRKYGIKYDDFMLIDRLNNPYELKISHGHTTAKYMLFNDYFNGMFDNTVPDGACEIYRDLAEKLGAIAKKSRRFAFLFDSAAKLASVLALKMDIGIRTRSAYKTDDKAELLRLAKEDYAEIAKIYVQLGETDKAEEYINRILAVFERHMIASEKENKSQILYSTTLRNAVPTEQICQKLLQNMVNITEFEQFKDKISALQSRYEEYIFQTRGEPNEN